MRYNYRISAGGLTSAPDGTVCVFVNPTDEERNYLVQELKLDEHTLASSLDPDELARLEFEPTHQAVIFKAPLKYSPAEPFVFKVKSVGAFIFKDRLVIVAPEGLLPTIEALRFKSTPTYELVFLRLMFRAINSFIEHLRVISQVSDELQGKIAVSMENRYLLNLFTLQKSLVYYLNFITSNGAVLQRLMNYAGRIGFTDEEREILEDISIENNQCRQQAEIFSNILASLMDARASIVSNNLNIRIKLLTVITIGIMVPTFVVSAFSMNVPIPLQTQPWMFWGVLGLSLLSALLFYFLVKYEKV